MNRSSLLGCTVAALFLALVASLAISGALYLSLKLREPAAATSASDAIEIGRASCRERV